MYINEYRTGMKSVNMKSFILIACFAALASANYENYKVFRVSPSTKDQLNIVKHFEEMKGIDFWSKRRILNKTIDIMVSPKMQGQFDYVMKHNNIPSEVIISNIETVFQRERMQKLLGSRMQKGKISHTQYNRYVTIVDYLNQLQTDHPDIVTVSSIGKSYEQRDMAMIKISTGGFNKPIILIDGGIHAREWISPASVVYFIEQLVENQANRYMIESVDWLIIPVLNPDGYEYTHEKNRLWRKTRSHGKNCIGTDANRNFDFHWMESGASTNECSETYAGPKRFSEIETRNLKEVVEKFGSRIKLYLTFHSYGELLLYPWGWTSSLPVNGKELDDLAQEVGKAIYAAGGTCYTIGSSTNILYPAAGGSDDWVMGVGGVSLAYTIELPGGGWNGFDPAPSDILPMASETWAGIKVYHAYIAAKYA